MQAVSLTTNSPSKDVNVMNDHTYSKTNIALPLDTLSSQNNNETTNGSDKEWQTVMPPNKRPRNIASSNCEITKKSRQSDSSLTVKTTNRFDAISGSDSMDEGGTAEPSQATETKPPPIFVPNVVDVKSMVTSIEAVISSDSYTYKCLSHNKFKINPVSVDAYRKLVHKLKALNVNFHTYQIKQDKAYRVVLKNMHFSTDVSEIKSAIEARGFQVRNVINMRQYKTKTPLSMFFVDLEPNPGNKDIFNLQYLLNAKITFEPPLRKNDIVQCKRCQHYGHTKTYCWHPYRCVKCGQGHDTRTCTKPPTSPPTCALCEGNHPANYKGCTVYRELKQKSFPPLRSKLVDNKPGDQSLQRSREERPSGPSLSVRTSSGRTYAQVTSNVPSAGDNGDQSTLNKTIQDFFNKFEKIMLQQAQQIGTLMNLLSTVVSKLK